MQAPMRSAAAWTSTGAEFTGCADGWCVWPATLAMTAAVLLYAACNDLKHLQIRSEVIGVSGALFVLHAFLSGRTTSMTMT